jgi:hypothetical protein
LRAKLPACADLTQLAGAGSLTNPGFPNKCG